MKSNVVSKGNIPYMVMLLWLPDEDECCCEG